MEQIARHVVEADAATHRDDPAVTRARAPLVDCQRKLDRYVKVLEAAMEPGLVVARTAEMERERTIAEAIVVNAPRHRDR